MRILLIAAIFLTAGCAVRQPVSPNWRLTSQTNARLLIPPGVTAAKAGYALDVEPGHGKCPPDVRPKRKLVVVTIDPDAISKRPAGWLAEWAGELESRGCIGRTEAPKFAESLPLDPAVGFRLRYPEDIEPPVRLQVVSPILRGDDQRELPLQVIAEDPRNMTIAVNLPANQLGYETALYDVRRKPNGDGFAIVPVSAERHIQDQVERGPQPLKNFLSFPAEAGFYRLFIKSNQTEFTALVIAAPDRAGLQREVTSCQSNDRMCATIPRRVAINEMVPVTVNGKEVMVRWGGNVGEAMRDSGGTRPENRLSTLSVSKLFEGRLARIEIDHSSPAILSLVLTGGEVITW